MVTALADAHGPAGMSPVERLGIDRHDSAVPSGGLDGCEWGQWVQRVRGSPENIAGAGEDIVQPIHPAFEHMMARSFDETVSERTNPRHALASDCGTSLSIARLLAAGCLARLHVSSGPVAIWDPCVGMGLAGHLLTEALLDSGTDVEFRGQDVNTAALEASQARFGHIPGARLALGDSLVQDEFEDFRADIVIVDAPWGRKWSEVSTSVKSRQRKGAYHFGLPERVDSTWLFLSLALEKLRRPEDGGGRVVAVVPPSSLRRGGSTAELRRHVMDEGFLESVVRLPDGLAPNTRIPRYLITFDNRRRRSKVMIGDLQTQFTTEHGTRRILDSAIRELESGLRTGKSGPRNRSVSAEEFVSQKARVVRATERGQRLEWSVTANGGTHIDERFLEARYGRDSGVSLDGSIVEVCDFDADPILRGYSKGVLEDLAKKKWPAVRLSMLLESRPRTVNDDCADDSSDGAILVPTGRAGRVTVGARDRSSGGRILAVDVDQRRIEPGFLAAWLNSEQGTTSRLRAIDESSTGGDIRALRSGDTDLLRWADELIVPVPPLPAQRRLLAADTRLTSFQEEIRAQRERIWAEPDGADAAVSRFEKVFDDSIMGWLSELPFPVASALWTAETARTPGDKLEAYFHAWEAFVAFHASALLSACRSDPGRSADVERSIRATLDQHGIGISRASFGTWNVIIEKTSKALRTALMNDDADEIARVSATFSELGTQTILRLLSNDITSKFKVVGEKRNRWQGHGGHVSDEQREERIAELVDDFQDLRRIVGDAWAQLPLVRAGSCRKLKTGFRQEVEVAMGERSPFLTKEYHVADAMENGELYLVRDGSQAPLRLVNFVQLRGAPSDARYTSYFYNRTEGGSVRMVSYQYGPESEAACDAKEFREDFGELLPE